MHDLNIFMFLVLFSQKATKRCFPPKPRKQTDKKEDNMKNRKPTQKVKYVPRIILKENLRITAVNKI